MLDKINLKISKQYSKNRKANAMQTPNYITYQYVFAYLLIVVYCAMDYYNPNDSILHNLIQYFILAIALIAVIIVTIISFKRADHVFQHFYPGVFKLLKVYF